MEKGQREAGVREREREGFGSYVVSQVGGICQYQNQGAVSLFLGNLAQDFEMRPRRPILH